MSDFPLDEASISDIQAGIRSRELECKTVIESYFSRIDALDREGPKINAIINTNPMAMDEADVLDRHFARTGELVGPLHGATVLVKDQIETAVLPTTFGSVAFRDFVAERDATVIRKIKEAGAIVLAKTLLSDFALSWFAFSSAGGEAKNPYALDRDPGGSSSGTGAGVAANLGTVGIGEDTGGSIRVPASFNNLVGLRVTTGLISRTGIQPLVVTDDTAGPMTRTVVDAARLLDVLVGYDALDDFTGVVISSRVQGGYASHLREDALIGARIGVLRQAFGPDSNTQSGLVNKVLERAIRTMLDIGCEIEDPVAIRDLDGLIEYTTLVLDQTRHDIDTYLSHLPNAPVRSIKEISETGQYHPMLELIPQVAAGPDDPAGDAGYLGRVVARSSLRRTVSSLMARYDLDALVYPSVQVLPPRKDDLRAGEWSAMGFPANTRLAAHIDFPAIVVPAGFTDDGVPVGIELLGKPFEEAGLMALAYSFEQATHHRRAPNVNDPDNAMP